MGRKTPPVVTLHRPATSEKALKDSSGSKPIIGKDGREGVNGYLLPHPDASGIGYFLDGRPVAKERPRLTVSLKSLYAAVMARDFQAAKAAFSVRTPTKTLRYEHRIAAITREAMGNMAATSGLIAIRIHFTLSLRSGGRPDIDNLVKTILDGMNNVFWVDDRQVRKLETTLEFSNAWPEGVVVMASVLDDEFEAIDSAIRNCISKRR